jgi:alpha-tubulin suppressor-like RCC1 family protein
LIVLIRLQHVTAFLAATVCMWAQAPVVALLQSPRQTVALGQPLTLGVAVSGATVTSYQWAHNGRPIPGATGASYTLSSATGLDDGWYTATATTSLGLVTGPVTFVNVSVPVSQLLEFVPANASAITTPSGETNLVTVAAGDSHTIALRADGTVAAWGANDQGQASVPAGLTDVVAIAAGGKLSLALKVDGRVVAWGSNDYGERNVPSDLSDVVAATTSGSHCLALRRDGTVTAWGDNYSGEATVPGNIPTVVGIAASWGYSLGVTQNGSLTVWGVSGIAYALPNLNQVVAVSAGSTFGLALNADGTVVDWRQYLSPSYSTIGGVPTDLKNVVAIGAADTNAIALKSDGTVTSWYTDDNAGPVVVIGPYGIYVPGGIDHVVAAAVGRGHVVLLRDASGDSSPTIEVQPTDQIANTGGTAWFSVAASGVPAPTYQWYFNGQKISGATKSSLQLTYVSPSSIGAYSVVVTNLKGAATSSTGRLSVLEAPVIQSISSPRQVVNSGGNLTLSVRCTSASVPAYQWTHNGQSLPGATSMDYTIAHATVADAGWYRAVVTNHVGSTTSAVVFVNVTINPARVVVWGSDSFGLANVPADLTDVAAVAGGYGHCLALRGDGTVVQWPTGSSMVVPAGLRDVVAIAAGRLVSVALKSDGSLVAWGVNASSVPAGGGIVSVGVNNFDSGCALRSDGGLLRWGSWGTSLPQAIGLPSAITVGLTHVLALKSDGSLQGWSSNSPASGAALIPADSGFVTAIAAGADHNVVLRADGSVFSWPGAASGDVPTPANLSGVVAIDAGGNDSLALKKDGTVVAWGDTSSGVTTIPASLARVGAIGMGTFNAFAVVDATPATLPAITGGPVGQTAAPGATVTFSVATAGSGVGERYQWYRNGQSLSGAVDARLVLPTVHASDAGAYSVVVTNAVGAVASNSAALTIDPALDPGRLVNLSVRARAGTGDQTLVAGFVIGGDSNATAKPVLIRGMGPSLQPFQVDDYLVDPRLHLYIGDVVVASNDDWLGDAQTLKLGKKVAAFDYTSTSSKDAAMAIALRPGKYTAHITGATGANGTALAELYDATPAESLTPTGPRLANISARAQVESDRTMIVAGFVIAGSTNRTVLIRGIGPALRAFQVGDALADPKLELFDDSGRINSNDDWDSSDVLAGIFPTVGAFGLERGSKDAALLVTLPPGKYTAQVSGVAGGSGVAMVEVYEVP